MCVHSVYTVCELLQLKWQQLIADGWQATNRHYRWPFANPTRAIHIRLSLKKATHGFCWLQKHTGRVHSVYTDPHWTKFSKLTWQKLLVAIFNLVLRSQCVSKRVVLRFTGDLLIENTGERKRRKNEFRKRLGCDYTFDGRFIRPPMEVLH